MVQLSHVYKTYGESSHALSNVHLDIPRGEFVFITGPSGAGKTTLFRLLSAFDRANSGQVTVAGYDLTRISTREIAQFRRKIGVVFQDFRLLKDRTIFENIALPLMIKNSSLENIKKRVERMLNDVGLWFKQDALPEHLSGGEQQRVAIARALIHQPGLLIADEPTGNLDTERSEEIMALFETANAQGTTVFVATHNQSLVEKRTRRLVKLKDGNLLDVNHA